MNVLIAILAVIGGLTVLAALVAVAASLVVGAAYDSESDRLRRECRERAEHDDLECGA